MNSTDPETGNFVGDYSLVKIHSADDFVSMRKAGKLAAEVLDYITPFVKPGVATEELDRLCHNYILDHGAIPAPLGYRGYPKSICTSINHVVCHGIPSAQKLYEGDILNIDVTVIVNGWHGDSSRMFAAGNMTIMAKRLVDTTYECLMLGIAAAKPGNSLGDIGHAIQTHAEANRYSVVRDFCGHGIGLNFHDEPTVLHYGSPGQGKRLVEGMFFTIEPMINVGGFSVHILKDGWTAVTRDR